MALRKRPPRATTGQCPRAPGLVDLRTELPSAEAHLVDIVPVSEPLVSLLPRSAVHGHRLRAPRASVRQDRVRHLLFVVCCPGLERDAARRRDGRRGAHDRFEALGPREQRRAGALAADLQSTGGV